MTATDSHTERAAALQAMGERLQQLRLQRSATIDDMAGQTRIQPPLLSAIEQGQLEELPDWVYLQGLVAKYAEALDLDGAAWAAQLSPPASATPPSTTVRASQPRSRGHWRPSAPLRPLPLYLGYILLVSLLVMGLSRWIERPSPPPEAVQPAPQASQAR